MSSSSSTSGVFDATRLFRAVADREAIYLVQDHERRMQRRRLLRHRQHQHQHDRNNDDDDETLSAGGLGSSSSSFGHPDPPRVQLFSTATSTTTTYAASADGASSSSASQQQLLLAFAYTKHFVYVQQQQSSNSDGYYLDGDESSSRPPTEEEVCRLPCCRDFPTDGGGSGGDQPDGGGGGVDDNENGGTRIRASEQQEEDDDDDDDRISCLAIVQLDDDDDDKKKQSGDNAVIRLAVVIGTERSRVYACELMLKPETTGSGRGDSCGRFRICSAAEADDEDDDGNVATAVNNLYEVFPPQDGGDNIDLGGRELTNRKYPFRPTGGVSSIRTFAGQRPTDNGKNQNGDNTFVWITYGDGTLLRVRAVAALFPSVWKRAAAANLSVDEYLVRSRRPRRRRSAGDDPEPAVLRCHVCIIDADGYDDHDGAGESDKNDNRKNTTVVPLPRSYPSPLASLPLEPWKVLPASSSASSECSSDENEEGAGDVDDNNTEPKRNPAVVEALVFGNSLNSNRNPTLTFYTSEVQFDLSDDHIGGSSFHPFFRSLSSASSHGAGRSGDGGNPVLGAVVGGTSAVVGGTKAIVGGVFNAFKWGIGAATGGNSSKAEKAVENSASKTVEESENTTAGRPLEETSDSAVDDKKDYINPTEVDKPAETACTPFPTLCHAPIPLVAGQELHDAPRQIESCSVDPDGLLAALSDSLGRVLLLDLETKQVIRMWKGYRDAVCSWIHGPGQSSSPLVLSAKQILYLVIYSRQRRVLDVWRVRHGPRVLSMVVERGAELVGPIQRTPSSHLASSFLLSSAIPGAPINLLELIRIDSVNEYQASVDTSLSSPVAGPARAIAQNKGHPSSSPYSKLAPSPREAALKLQHLRQLLSTSTVMFTSKDVYQALTEITSLVDLATALDLLACATVMDEKLGVDGSDFHKQVVAYCQKMLDGSAPRPGGGTVPNPNVALLEGKIEYHSKVSFSGFGFFTCASSLYHVSYFLPPVS